MPPHPNCAAPSPSCLPLVNRRCIRAPARTRFTALTCAQHHTPATHRDPQGQGKGTCPQPCYVRHHWAGGGAGAAAGAPPPGMPLVLVSSNMSAGKRWMLTRVQYSSSSRASSPSARAMKMSCTREVCVVVCVGGGGAAVGCGNEGGRGGGCGGGRGGQAGARVGAGGGLWWAGGERTCQRVHEHPHDALPTQGAPSRPVPVHPHRLPPTWHSATRRRVEGRSS